MIRDLARSFGALTDPRARGVVWLGIGLSILTLALLTLGVDALLGRLAATGYGWLDRTVEILGTVGTLIVAWLFFPSVVVAVSSLFLERVVDLTEERYYPGLPAPRPVPMVEQVLSALRLLGISLLLNLLVVPLYLLPAISLVVWILLNGYLVGREYFELVAQRQMAPEALGPARRKARWTFWSGGAVIAFLLAVPLLNLAAPVIGAAFMTHRLRRAKPGGVLQRLGEA
jgi:uncharacterized protein involved in cysteine biosynthesis